MKKRRVIFKILLIVFLVFVIFLVGMCIRHWNTIIAVIDGLNYSVEEIENIRIENQKVVDKELEKYPDLHFRNLTGEEITALSEGKISQDDIPYLVTGRKVYVDGEVITIEEYEKRTDSEKNDSGDDNKSDAGDDKENKGNKSAADKTDNESSGTDSGNKSSGSNSDNQQNVPKTNEELEAVLQKFFVLKANFLADIESRVNGMIAEYKSYPKKERTKALRSTYANNAISLMSQLEPQYDAQFESVVAELETVVEKIGADSSLIDTVRTAYRNEKAALKAKYVSKAKKHL